MLSVEEYALDKILIDSSKVSDKVNNITNPRMHYNTRAYKYHVTV